MSLTRPSGAVTPFLGFPITNVGNARGVIVHVGHDGMPALAPTPYQSGPFVMAALPPTPCLLCSTSCQPGPFVMPALAPLSFPQVFSGNPGFFSSVPLFGWPCVWKSHGFPITNVGNDRRAIEHVGHDGMPALAPTPYQSGPFVMAALPPTPCLLCSTSCQPGPFVMPALAPLSFPQVFSGNPGFFSSVPLFGWPCVGKSHGFPITNVGNDRGVIVHVGHDRGAINHIGNDRGVIVQVGHDGRACASSFHAFSVYDETAAFAAFCSSMTLLATSRGICS